MYGAARWLLARPVVPVGTVYKGIQAREALSPERLDRALNGVDRGPWWFTSTSPDRAVAVGYAGNAKPDRRLILEVTGARGVRLRSMGRLASTPEVLLRGRMSMVGDPR